MKFEEFYIENKEGKSNCVIRSFSKMYNIEYDSVYSELISISERLNLSFNSVEVFEEYMKLRNTYIIDYEKDIKIKDLNLDNDNYIVFAYDKKDYYHMACIKNNTLYDKDKSSLELYVIQLYKHFR